MPTNKKNQKILERMKRQLLKKDTSITQLAKQCKVSERTIFRYLECLELVTRSGHDPVLYRIQGDTQ